jgi:anaerobic selenocysteine-containing dehydrogenase
MQLLRCYRCRYKHTSGALKFVTSTEIIFKYATLQSLCLASQCLMYRIEWHSEGEVPSSAFYNGNVNTYVYSVSRSKIVNRWLSSVENPRNLELWLVQSRHNIDPHWCLAQLNPLESVKRILQSSGSALHTHTHTQTHTRTHALTHTHTHTRERAHIHSQTFKYYCM